MVMWLYGRVVIWSCGYKPTFALRYEMEKVRLNKKALVFDKMITDIMHHSSTILKNEFQKSNK